MDLLAERVRDRHPRVRLEALRALSRVPGARAAELVLGALELPMDEHLDYAVWLSINDLVEPWIEAIEAGDWKTGGREAQLEFGLKAVPPEQAGRVLSHLLADRELPADGSGPWLELIGIAGRPAELGRVLERLARGGFNARGTTAALEALVRAAEVRQLKPDGDLAGIQRFMVEGDPADRLAAIRLAGQWKLEDALPVLLGFAKGGDTPPALRDAAIGSLREIGGQAAAGGLASLAEQSTLEYTIRARAVAALAAIAPANATSIAVDVLGDSPDEESALGLWRDLLSVRGAAPRLATALPPTGIPPVVASAGLRAAREGGRNHPDLVLALSRGADLDDRVKELTPEEIQELMGGVMRDGNAARGEMVYRRAELGCVNCHAIGGVGGRVGPDLTSIGASAPLDYLIESMLYPNRKVKEGYHSIVLETRDGQELSGVLVRESSDQLFIRNVLDQEVAVAKANVANRTMGNSLMPSGLIDYLPAGERLDLLRFLAELGKPGPFDASKSTVALRWWLQPETIDLAQFGIERILNSELSGDDWLPVAGTVNGRLLNESLREGLAAKAWRDPQAVYAATRFATVAGGDVQFRIEAPANASLWIGGRAVELKPAVTINLEAGEHLLFLKLGARSLPGHVRVSSDQATFLTD
jgi:putative heme-binding domain-containing protein